MDNKIDKELIECMDKYLYEIDIKISNRIDTWENR